MASVAGAVPVVDLAVSTELIEDYLPVRPLAVEPGAAAVAVADYRVLPPLVQIVTHDGGQNVVLLSPDSTSPSGWTMESYDVGVDIGAVEAAMLTDGTLAVAVAVGGGSQRMVLVERTRPARGSRPRSTSRRRRCWAPSTRSCCGRRAWAATSDSAT